MKADVSSSSSLPPYKRENSLLMLRADSVLSRLETCSSTSSACGGSASTASSARGAPTSSMPNGLLAARARHRACVGYLRSIEEQMEELVAENESLRSSNMDLHQQNTELQVKHDAAQCHLDNAITQAVTPRTRKSLEAQNKLLQPALGMRLASSFVEAQYQRSQKEKVTRQLYEYSSESCATKSGAACESALSRTPDGPLPDANGDVDDACSAVNE
eukprot:UN1248